MNVVIIVFLILIVGYFVGYPLIKPEYEEEIVVSSRKKLKTEKEALMTTLNEIEFDYKMGKLSEDDYEIMKNKYKHAALAILKDEEDQSIKKSIGKQDDAKTLNKIDEEIEEELKKMRAKKAGSK